MIFWNSGFGAESYFWNSGFGAESYHVTYSSDNGKNWSAAASDLPVGNGTTEITIKSLDNPKTYTVAVRAYNKNGYSGWRNSSPSGPYVPIVAPPKPKNVKAYPGNNAVTFIWDKPVDLGDAEVTGYQAAYWLNPGDCAFPATIQWYNIYGSNGDMVYYTMPGLTNGTKYGVALRAVNQGTPGTGVGTCVTPIAGVNPPPFVPPAPESLNVIRGDGTLTVTWHPSRTATGYQVDYKTYDSKSWKMAAWWNATTSIILSGMNNDTAYAVRVRGRNDRGDGPWSYMPVSVSNLDETTHGNTYIGRYVDKYSQASAFTTGSNSGGYTLGSVTINVSSISGSPTGLNIAIHASSGGNPASTPTHTLTGTSPSGAGNVTYSCHGACGLEAGTDYFIVLSATIPGSGDHYYLVDYTTSDNQTNAPSGAGWSISDVAKYEQNDSGNWADNASSYVHKLKVTALPK